MTTNDIIWNQARPIVQSNSNDKQVWTALLSKVQVDYEVSSTAKMNTRNREERRLKSLRDDVIITSA